jgi:hypothetical protein
LVLMKKTQDGTVRVPLANWTARIVEQLVQDDGVERQVALAVEGRMGDGAPLPRARVPADRFARMGWPVEHWGARAVVYAGQGVADHARVAVQLLSGDPPTRIEYLHTGWRDIGGEPVYLHGGGAIGAGGPAAGVEVRLTGPLAGCVLPEPPAGDRLVTAVRASLRVLGVSPDRVTVPVLGAAYRAVLDATDFSLHLSGPTKVGKTEHAALAQQHWGAGLDARHLPGSWSSTGNSLESLAFFAKDMLLTVDDFAPQGRTADVARYHRDADRLFRAQGNRSGRARCRTDGSLREPHPPRGSILSTGEDLPRGESVRARLLVVELSAGETDWAQMTGCQEDARNGLYAEALAGFVQWLAPRIDTVQAGLRSETAGYRGKVTRTACTRGRRASSPTWPRAGATSSTSRSPSAPSRPTSGRPWPGGPGRRCWPPASRRPTTSPPPTPWGSTSSC